MATPTPAAHLPTRQQLDEIDALLRRMLTLPPLAGEAASEPATAPPAPAAAVTYPVPVVREVARAATTRPDRAGRPGMASRMARGAGAGPIRGRLGLTRSDGNARRGALP